VEVVAIATVYAGAEPTASGARVLLDAEEVPRLVELGLVRLPDAPAAAAAPAAPTAAEAPDAT
jgi:hypothetical protein